MTALAHEIGDHPILLALLNRFDCEREQFAAAKATADQRSQHGMVARISRRCRSRVLQQPSALFGRQPVSETHAETPDAFDAADAGGEFGAQESGIGGFVRDTADGRQS